MRAKQSFTASELYSSSETLTPAVPMRGGMPDGAAIGGRSPIPPGLLSQPHGESLSCLALVQGEGLLHDARNLMGALGLYCDLLSMPGVLKPEHRHYAEEVRLLGERSAAMIQRLMEHRVQAVSPCSWPGKSSAPSDSSSQASLEAQSSRIDLPAPTERIADPVSLQSIVERSSGLLSRVAGGRTIEITYGAAAAVPVKVEEEAVERILVNLVRNSSAALGRCSSPGSLPGNQPASIRIGVGMLVNRVGDPKPWPFRRVRLTIEDSGCGMPPEQLERLLSGSRAPSRGSHGIGFRVVRDLVAASSGDLRAKSTPGAGTLVQIEWPAAPPASEEIIEGGAESGVCVERRLSC